jgi:hypothetical protein
VCKILRQKASPMDSGMHGDRVMLVKMMTVLTQCQLALISRTKQVIFVALSILAAYPPDASRTLCT